jgi:hypothetical protein
VAHDSDHYESLYADKLWSLLPEVYRADDADAAGGPGPLRELVERIGAQAAILRRSIDRLWDDQSIETCDDWLIPYIGDLLATNLVSSLDARGKRLDVAKTIYYRRRKGTLAVLEELAGNVTSWEAHVVEFFRRLGRTRHGLDPEIGLPSATDDPAGNRELQRAEGLTGPLTGTPMGGFADLRHVYGADRVGTAYDEFFHTADVRLGRGATGWYGIPKLGVFLWRLISFHVPAGTPVPCSSTGNLPPVLFTFDPTGRLAPLFAHASRTAASYGNAWVSPEEWQLPGRLSAPLYEAQEAELYPGSVEVLRRQGSFLDQVDPKTVEIHPELGTFRRPAAIQPDELVVSYHYGFPSRIGAGPYDRRLVGAAKVPTPAPVRSPVSGGGSLAAELGALGADGTVTIADSLTYDAVADVGGGAAIHGVTIRARNRQRPVIRLDGTAEWSFTGDGGELVLDGIFLSGADVVLRGTFASVRLTCCTLDPGTAGTPPDVFAKSVDARQLRPSRLLVEAHVERLEIERCVLGGVRARNGGEVEAVRIADSIVQAIRTSDLSGTVPLPFDPVRLFVRLKAKADPLSLFLHDNLGLSQADVDGFQLAQPPVPPSKAAQNRLATDLGSLVEGGASLYDPQRFALVDLSASTGQAALAPPVDPAELAALNRRLLEEAYPLELADLALGLGDGAVELERCTILGRAHVHRLTASECILDDFFVVEDLQHGCVRFTAYAEDSVLPRKYESVSVADEAPLFATRTFGRPAYAQLASTVDRAILAGSNTISAGGPTGSELGAYASELGPIKERSLRVKFEEFMPIGLSPVLVYVT